MLSRSWAVRKNLMKFCTNGSSIGLPRGSVRGNKICFTCKVVIIFFTSARRKREADGFLRGIIIANNISREEAAEYFKVGQYRYNRLRNMDPSKAIPKRPPAKHRVTLEDTETVRIFMKALNSSSQKTKKISQPQNVKSSITASLKIRAIQLISSPC